MVLSCAAAPAEASPRQDGVRSPERQLASDLVDPDIEKATARFTELMSSPDEFGRLAWFMNEHPKRYAQLLLAAQDPPPAKIVAPRAWGDWTDYIHRRTRGSRHFARCVARVWREGFQLDVQDVLPKLSNRFPSTRRAAIEFLKQESERRDFGFDWRATYKANRTAIEKWQLWMTTGRQRS